MHVIVAEPSLHARPAPVHPQGLVRGNLEHPVVLDVQDQRAPDPAVGTGGGYFFKLPFPAFKTRGLWAERPHRADAHAVAAENARGLFHVVVERGRHLCIEPPLRVVHRFAVLDFMADRDAPSAKDALVVIPLEERVGGPQGEIVLFALESGPADPELVGVFFQEAGAALLASHAVVRDGRKGAARRRFFARSAPGEYWCAPPSSRPPAWRRRRRGSSPLPPPPRKGGSRWSE